MMVLLVDHCRSFFGDVPNFRHIGELVCIAHKVECLEKCISSILMVNMINSYIQGQSLSDEEGMRHFRINVDDFNRLDGWKTEFPWCLGTLDTTPWGQIR